MLFLDFPFLFFMYHYASRLLLTAKFFFLFSSRTDNTVRLITDETGQPIGCQALLVRQKHIVRPRRWAEKAYSTNSIINGSGKPLDGARWRMNWGIIWTRRWFPTPHPSKFFFLHFFFLAFHQDLTGLIPDSTRSMEIHETKRHNFDFKMTAGLFPCVKSGNGWYRPGRNESGYRLAFRPIFFAGSKTHSL